MDFKIKQLPILAFLFTALNFSCKKLLDVKQSNKQILLTTAADCQLLLDDYAVMNENYPSDGELSAGDFYLNATGYASTAVETQTLYTWVPTALRSSANPQWVDPYNVVYNANLVLECVAKIHDDTSQATLDYVKGSALFFRSFAFWNEAQLYAQPYDSSTAAQDPGIPLRLSSDINTKTTRSTVQQTYDQIIGDLKQSAALMANTSSVASRPSKAAAYAMLARVYLANGDYPDALNAAGAALQINSQLIDYNTLNPSSSTIFSPRFNKEDIFHSVMTPEPAMQPGASFALMARIDSALAASYVPNDLRGIVFISSNGDGTFRFVGNYEPTYYYADFFDGLAVDELYLIHAECYARAGNASAAMTDLNTLLRTRWRTNTYTDMTYSSADDALAKILVERRKELLMRGLRWSDLRRLNKDPRFKIDLTRTIKDANGNIQVSATLPAGDPRYTLLIPQEVINNSGIPQNAR
jgi:hypothetical protein